MAIPKPSQTKQPILNYLARATAPVKIAALIEEVGRHFNLTKEEREARMPGGMGRLTGNVNAAVRDLKTTGLAQSPRFGHLEITATGRETIQGAVAEPQAPTPTKEVSSPPAQPVDEPEAQKQEAQSASAQTSNEEGIQELQTPMPISEEAPAKRRGRPRKVDVSPTPPISKKETSEPKKQIAAKKETDVSPAQSSQREEVQTPQAQPVPASDDGRFVELTSQIVSSYVAKTTIDLEQVPEFIKSTHAALAGLGQPESDKPATSQKPAVSIEESVTGDYIICLEDGKKLKALKRYLGNKYNMSPEEYRTKWGLSPDYPMNAPNYVKERSENAKRMWLGRKPSTGRKKTA